MAYPQDTKHLDSPFATDSDRNIAINALIERVGELRAFDPATIEDRLYTIEMLVCDILMRLGEPPGKVR